jgi:hypothetical protein
LLHGLLKLVLYYVALIFNVPVGYLFTSKIKLRTPSGKEERKGRGFAGQHKQQRRETCVQMPTSVHHIHSREVAQSLASSQGF